MTAHQIDAITGNCPACSARRYEIDDNVAPVECWGASAWRTAWQHVERGFEKSEMLLDLSQQRRDLHEGMASLREMIDQRNEQIADLTRRLSAIEAARPKPEGDVVEEYFRTWMAHKHCNPIADLAPTPSMAEAIELHQKIARERLDMSYEQYMATTRLLPADASHEQLREQIQARDVLDIAQRTERRRVISMGGIAGTSTNAPPPPDPSHTSTSQTDAAQKREPDQKQIEQGKALTRAFTRA